MELCGNFGIVNKDRRPKGKRERMEVGARAPADYIVNAVYYRRHPSKDMHTHMYCNSGLLG